MDTANIPQPNLQHSISVEINYVNCIRSIDLENILSGFRMILQHELASRTGKSPRSFTDVATIEGIEKGSIVINMLFDLVNINVGLADVNVKLFSIDIDVLDIILMYLAKPAIKEGKEKLSVYIEGIKNALKRVKNINVKAKDRMVVLKCNNNGDIVSSDITNNHQEV